MTKKLRKSDWLDFGLKRLVKSGPGALKAEPLAKAMKVSRGSFYWHFEDIESFRRGILALWREKATQHVVYAVNDEPSSEDSLCRLLSIAFTSELDMERAIRAWAMQDPDVSAIVEDVDAERVEYIKSLLAEIGYEPDDARMRAVFLYWAFLGQVSMPSVRGKGIDADGSAKMARLLLQRVDQAG
ncbi:TetR/AcrR family transcriptional regulator [Ruegeria hyattellae]|uniref:TetR/AcrR family transcriptional regulator n=1 Tax=Ruegeria hyattellae TaxID=3233337 RepID=UPI00355C44CF